MQVSSTVAIILGRAVADQEPLTLAGLDSLGAIEVQKELSRYTSFQSGHLLWNSVFPLYDLGFQQFQEGNPCPF